MSRKKILKRSYGEKIEKKELNEIFHLEIGLVSVLVIISIFSLISLSLEMEWVQYNLLDLDIYGQASRICIDSDNGINQLLKGKTTGVFNEDYTTKTDECIGNKVKEYYCKILDCPSCIYSKEINCPNNCIEGECT